MSSRSGHLVSCRKALDADGNHLPGRHHSRKLFPDLVLELLMHFCWSNYLFPVDVETLKAKYEALAPMLNERTRRLWAAAEAEAIGHGGITRVARATGMSRSRIARGIRELKSNDSLDPGRIRRPGGGRKRLVDTDETLLSDFNALLVPVPVEALPGNSRPGEPKSIRMLTAELRARGHSVSRRLVNELLQDVGYTRKPRKKVCRFLRNLPS